MMLLAHSGRFVTIGLAIVATLGGCAPESGAGEGAVSHAASLEVDQDGYVSTPGARARAECVHEVPNGASVGTEDGDDVVRHNGKIVARYSPCGFPVRSGNVASRSEMQPEPDAVDAVPDGIGKQTFPLITVGRPSWTAWTQTEILSLVGNTRWFSEIDATMVIPATPVSYVSQLLYWFPALCPHDGSSILQPVLQYGPGPSGGGGNYWSFAGWYISSSGSVFHSSLQWAGASGTSIPTNVHATSCNSSGVCNWNIEWILGGTLYGYAVSSPQRYKNAFMHVLEEYYVSACNQFPGDNVNTANTVKLYYSAQASPNTKTLIGYGGATAGTNTTSSPQCGFGASVASGTASIFY